MQLRRAVDDITFTPSKDPVFMDLLQNCISYQGTPLQAAIGLEFPVFSEPDKIVRQHRHH